MSRSEMMTAITSQEDTIYAALRTDILDLKLRPGMIISIRDIGETYGVGRTPVRDALIRLSKEGLITFLPQRGTMISRIDFDRAENERFLRSCVEEKVMLEFMASVTQESVRELEESMERQAVMAGEGDCRAFLEEDIRYHSVFYKGAGRDHCARVVHANSGDYRRIRLLTLTDNGISSGVVHQHKELLQSILKKDEGQMHELFTLHLNRMTDQERFLAKKYADLFVGQEVEKRRKNDGLSEDFLAGIRLHY